MKAARVLLLLAMAGGLAAVQFVLMEPESTPLWQELFNSGHAPLYGVLSWIVLVVLDIARPTWRRGARYLQALAVSVVLGGVMEALQYFGARDAQLADFARDALGSAAFLAFAASFDRSLVLDGAPRSTAKRIALRGGAVGLLGVAFVPVILAGGAIVARDHAFPRVCGFDTLWERRLVFVNESADLEYRRAPGGQPDGDDFAAYVTFRPGQYSILTLSDPHPDWTAFGSLSFTVYSDLDEAVTLTLWIEDDHHRKGSQGYFLRRLTVEPGENRFEFALSDVRTTAKNRELDLTRIHKIALYGTRVEEPFSLLFDDFRLESGTARIAGGLMKGPRGALQENE